MAKKRKTRQEKIIRQLKRELAKQRQILASASIKSKPRQGAISKRPQVEPRQPKSGKKTDASVFFYNPHLAMKDLLKTLILTLVVLSLEFMLYWRLR